MIKLGETGEYNVGMDNLPGGEYGLTSVASVSRDMMLALPRIRFGLTAGKPPRYCTKLKANIS
jgi:hypothetical protein